MSETIRVGANLGAAGNPLVEERNTTTVHESNGTVRVQFGTPGQDPNAPVYTPDQSRPDAQMVTRIDGNGRLVQQPGVVRANSADLPAIPRTGASVLATMQNSWGAPSQRAGLGSSVELIPGRPESRTSLANAAREGLISFDGNSWHDVGAQPAAPADAPQVQQPEQQTEQPKQHDQSTTDGQMSYIIDRVSTALGNAWQETAAAMIVGKDVDAEHIARISGQPIEYVREALPMATAAMHAKAMYAAKSVGLDTNSYDDMREWASKHPEGRAAVSELVFGGRTDGVKRMAQLYMQAVKPTQQALNSGGLKTWTDNMGNSMVDVPGYGPMSVAAASKLKLL